MDVLPLEHSGCVGCCFSARPQHMHVVADGVPACNQQKNYLFNNYLFIRKTHAIYMAQKDTLIIKGRRLMDGCENIYCIHDRYNYIQRDCLKMKFLN